MKRAVLSVIAGLVAAALFAAFATAAGDTILSGHGAAWRLAGILFLLFPIALVVVVLLGLPTFAILYRFAPGRWWMPLVAGSILGFLGMLVIFGDPTEEYTTRVMLTFVPISAMTAQVFWLVWRTVEEQPCTC